MKIFASKNIKEIDAYTIRKEPISSIDLMERAAHALTDAIVRKWNSATPITVFAGPGNNGGDALAVARMLLQKGYRVNTFLFNTKGKLSDECQQNKERLEAIEENGFTEVSSQFTPPPLTQEHIVIDGLFGSGLNAPLSGGFAAVVKYINASPATVVAIDIPSGLMSEDNALNNRSAIIRARYTLSLQFPKLAFLFAENAEFVGEWSLLDIKLSPEGIKEIETPYFLLEKEEIQPLLKTKSKFAHKGIFGHALLIAGSRGMAGASLLAARACMRSGAGLLTVYAPTCNRNILQTSIPEAIVKEDLSDSHFSIPVDCDDYRAVGIGPGLGQSAETAFAVLEQISTCQTPMVIDADAINILSEYKQALASLPKGSILTPHLKELERLIGKCQHPFERLIKARELAHKCKVFIVLKGAHTAIITPDEKIFFNSTGNPGMATAGSGDVLTGVILALLAQGYTSEEAAKIGVFIHGAAGDLALQKYGDTALTASDIVEFLPAAWMHI